MNKRIEQITKYKKPEESPGYLLWNISLLWRTKIEEALKSLGLTHPQFVVLATTGWLTRNNENISQADVSRASGFDPNTLSQILRGLEEKKLIKRVRVLNERIKSPTLTALGLEKLSLAMPAVEAVDTKFFALLNKHELEQLISIFQLFMPR
ncbi:MAG: MarR family winged helix-turn-helix transcriptional regulator [Candidatus Dependentiae bacterium]